MRALLFSCFSFIALAAQALAEPVGTLVKDFNFEVVKLAQDPVRPRIYATTTDNSVIVIDTDTVQLVKEIFIGSQPDGLDVNADGSRLYVACSGSTTAGIGVIDLTTLTKLPSLPTPFRPADLAAGLADRLYVSFRDDESLRQLSATDGAVQAAFGSSLFGGGRFRLTPDRQKLFYGDLGYSPATLARFNVSTATPSLVQISNFGQLGENGQTVIMSHGGEWVCYAAGYGQGGYNIALIPTTDVNATIGLLHCDAYPTNGAFSPDDAPFYTAPDTQQKVRIFNTTTFVETGSFPTSEYEVGEIIADRNDQRLYVASTPFFEPGKLHVYALKATNAQITSAGAATAHEGESFNFMLTCDAPGATFAATGLPAGLSLDPVSGLISGIPTQAGVFAVAITATTPQGGHATGQLAINVQTPFTVAINGAGTVTPGGAGTSWQTVGAVLEFLATPGGGFGFIGWTGAATSSDPHLFVVVQPDAMLQANFTQLVPFTVTVAGPGTVPPAFLGTTQQALGTTLNLVATPNAGARFTGWTGAVTAAENPLSIVVSSGAVLTANFETLPLAPLTVLTSGPGQVPAEFLGTTQRPVGSTVTITATPIAGARFAGWTGAVTSTANPLTFNVTAAATLVANFESFTIYGGRYTAVAPPDAGGVHLVVLRAAFDSSGAFTGMLNYGGVHRPLTGVIDDLTGTDLLIARSTAPTPLHLHLALSLENGVPAVLATLTDGAASFALRGFRVAAFGGAHPTPLAGRYTFIIPPPAGSPVLGHGNGVAKISASGAVTFAGALGDGSAFAAGGAIAENGSIPLAVPLYGGLGYLAGQLDFRDAPGASDFDGALNWSRPARPQTLRYPAGFSKTATLLGARYVPPAAGKKIFAGTTGNVTISGGNLAAALTTPVILSANNVVTPANTANGLQCTLDGTLGLFTGSFLPPGTTTPRAFRGVVYQKMTEAVAVHRGTTVAGSVVLTPTTH